VKDGVDPNIKPAINC